MIKEEMPREEMHKKLQDYVKVIMRKNQSLRKENSELKDDVAFLKRVICGILMRNGSRIALTRDILEMPEPSEDDFGFEENTEGEPILVIRKLFAK